MARSLEPTFLFRNLVTCVYQTDQSMRHGHFKIADQLQYFIISCELSCSHATEWYYCQHQLSLVFCQRAKYYMLVLLIFFISNPVMHMHDLCMYMYVCIIIYQSLIKKQYFSSSGNRTHLITYRTELSRHLVPMVTLHEALV